MLETLARKKTMLVRIETEYKTPDFRQQTPGGTGIWGDLELTYEQVPECDLLLVVNCPYRDIRVRVPPGRKWLFSMESPVDMYRWHVNSFQHFDRVFTFWEDGCAPVVSRDQTALPWHIGKSYDQLMQLEIETALAQKKNAVSWVTSSATHKPGHKLRMALKDELVADGFLFDLFGRGFTPIEDKFQGIFGYKYSLAIENFACDNYWTEKIADCFLSWTMPIYWGAPNILSYFPEKSMILIDPSNPKAAIKTIRHAMADGRFEDGLPAIAEARDLILNRYQLFPHLARLLAAPGQDRMARKESVYIPTNKEYHRNESSLGSAKRILKRMLRV